MSSGASTSMSVPSCTSTSVLAEGTPRMLKKENLEQIAQLLRNDSQFEEKANT